jgi:hypothetical protein
MVDTATRRPGRLNLSREGCASLLVGGHSGSKATKILRLHTVAGLRRIRTGFPRFQSRATTARPHEKQSSVVAIEETVPHWMA